MKEVLIGFLLVLLVSASFAQEANNSPSRKLTFGAEYGFMSVTGDYKTNNPSGGKFDLMANYRVSPRINVGIRIGVDTYGDNRSLAFIPIQAELKGLLYSSGNTPFAIVRGGYSLVRPTVGSRGEVFSIGAGWRFMLGKRCSLSPTVGYHYQAVYSEIATYDQITNSSSNKFEKFDPLKSFFVSLAFEF